MDNSPSHNYFFWLHDPLFKECYFSGRDYIRGDLYLASIHFAVFYEKADVFEKTWDKLKKDDTHVLKYFLETISDFVLLDTTQSQMINYMLKNPKIDFFACKEQIPLALEAIIRTEGFDGNKKESMMSKLWLSLPDKLQDEIVDDLSKTNHLSRHNLLLERLAVLCSFKNQEKIFNAWKKNKNHDHLSQDQEFPFLTSFGQKKEIKKSLSNHKNKTLGNKNKKM